MTTTRSMIYRIDAKTAVRGMTLADLRELVRITAEEDGALMVRAYTNGVPAPFGSLVVETIPVVLGRPEPLPMVVTETVGMGSALGETPSRASREAMADEDEVAQMEGQRRREDLANGEPETSIRGGVKRDVLRPYAVVHNTAMAAGLCGITHEFDIGANVLHVCGGAAGHGDKGSMHSCSCGSSW